MEALLMKEMRSATCRAIGGPGQGGCISNGQSYLLDGGRKAFVKHNSDPNAKVMFEGESKGLEAIMNTKTIAVPTPIKVVPYEGWVFIMEHLELLSVRQQMKELGRQLALLHLHNISLKDVNDSTSLHKDETQLPHIDKFGFECTTCCGFIPMPNDWTSDWIEFYTRNRLQPQIDLVVKKYNNREVTGLWSHLQLKIPQLFTGIDPIYPSLLHGDLWSGNAAETIAGPVVFDPAVLYGHHEFELSISAMFGGFNKDFYDSYHSLIPKSHGFKTRQKLYQLFHYLNHWNHFGSGYQHQSINLIKELINS